MKKADIWTVVMSDIAFYGKQTFAMIINYMVENYGARSLLCLPKPGTVPLLMYNLHRSNVVAHNYTSIQP